MADLTIGEVFKILQLNLFSVDNTQSPPVNTPLNLTNAASVTLEWLITSPDGIAAAPSQSKSMTITNATGGTVQYSFQANDLVKPANMGKNGIFRYTVKVVFNDGTILFPNSDGKLTIKDDSVL